MHICRYGTKLKEDESINNINKNNLCHNNVMQENSIFTRIINGEFPCHKVYEDDNVLAFLDIHPSQPGHTLVVPKNQVDRLEDLPDTEYAALLSATKKIMRRVVEVMGSDYRACVKVEGFVVPHAHIHIVPCRSVKDFTAQSDPTSEPDHAALAAMAQKLAIT